MQKRTLKRIGRRLGEACLLVALPALALAAFSPRAWGTLTLHGPQIQDRHLAQAAVLPTAPAEAATELRQWTDTQSTNPITLNLVQQARDESAALNNAVRSLRAQIIQASQKNSGTFSTSFTVAFLLQSLDLTARERTRWDSTWRLIGVPHANQTTVQNTLINLQVAFVNANALLISFQGTEIQAGSISTFTPPAF